MARSYPRDSSYTITLEEYRAATEGKLLPSGTRAQDLSVLRRTGTDMSAHTSQPESQACVPSNPCDGEFICSRHRPTSRI